MAGRPAAGMLRDRRHGQRCGHRRAAGETFAIQAAALAILAAALAPAAAAGWTQLGGAPGHGASVAAPPGLLDVVEVLAGLPDGHVMNGRLGPYAAHANGTATMMAQSAQSAACSMFRAPLSQLASAPAATPLRTCQDGSLAAVDETSGAVLACMSRPGAQAVLAAYDAQGAELWAFVPAEQAQQLAAAQAGGQAGNAANAIWSCSGLALAGGHAFVPLQATGTGGEPVAGAVAKLNLTTGEPAWITSLQSSALRTPQAASTAALACGAINVEADCGGVGAADFLPWAATVTDTGVVVAGQVSCTLARACSLLGQGATMPYLAWLDAQGTLMGGRQTRPHLMDSPDDVEGTPRFEGMLSGHATSHGATAAALLGGELVLVDPSRLEPLAVPHGLDQATAAIGSWPAPAWSGDLLAVATAREVMAIRTRSLDDAWAAPWSAPLGWDVVGLSAEASGRFLAVVARLDGPASSGDGGHLSAEAMVVVLDRNGRAVQQLPLPAVTAFDAPPALAVEGASGWGQPPTIVDLGAGPGVVDAEGHLFRLGTAPEPPRLRASATHPKAGAQVTLEVDAPGRGTPVAILVAWGDDGTGEQQPALLEGHHAVARYTYRGEGTRTVVATALYADNTTASASIDIHVGAPPPPTLNAFQVAFDDEHRDTTWGVLGLVLGALGAFWGWLKVRRSKGKVARALDRLDAIRRTGAVDPVQALRELHLFRLDVRDRVGAGDLEEGQGHLLETRSVGAAKALLFRAMAPMRERLSPMFQAMLVGLFEDGRLTEAEEAQALAALGKERLPPEQRQALASLLRLLSPE